MTKSASGHRAAAGAGDAASSAASAAPFVLNLCSSTTPMALAQTDLAELKRFTFFVSRRFEEGRERFRLHMGYFATLGEAEEWLGLVREIYPGAWAGEAPGRRIRERTAATAAAAQQAAGPQTQAGATASTAASTARRVGATPETPVATAPAPSRGPGPVTAPLTAPQALRVPVVHAAPPVARAVPPPLPPPVPQAPVSAAIAAAAAKAAPSAKTYSRTRSEPPAQSAPSAKAAPSPKSVPPVKTAPAPRGRTAANARAACARVPATARVAAPGSAAKRNIKPVFEDSNVREVLKALGDGSTTGETRLMRAPPAPGEIPPPESGSLSDTQVLRLLESRREGGEPGQDEPAFGIPLLKPDDTGTRRALREAVASNATVSFAVQLQWSVQPVELDKVPPLAIFGAYTLYTVEGSRDGRKWYGLRLGFFSDAISAKQVAQYVRSEFTSVAVLPVSPQEKARATDEEQSATLAAPARTRERTDEFKLIEEESAAGRVGKSPAAQPDASARSGKPAPRLALGRALQQADAARPALQRAPGTVGARDRRGPHTLEETLEILGAGQLSIDTGNGETINDSGVRHLRVQVQKNSPFSRLLERLSERMRKA